MPPNQSHPGATSTPKRGAHPFPPQGRPTQPVAWGGPTRNSGGGRRLLLPRLAFASPLPLRAFRLEARRGKSEARQRQRAETHVSRGALHLRRLRRRNRRRRYVVSFADAEID